MSYHSFTPEWTYSRVRFKDTYSKEWGWSRHTFDSVRNHPHYSGMYGMAQSYFYWFEGGPDDLVAKNGYYYLYGSPSWWGMYANREKMPCWQFHCDDHREYMDWEWWPLRDNWKDNRGCIHYRKRFEGKGEKPRIANNHSNSLFNIIKANEYGETMPAVRTFVRQT